MGSPRKARAVLSACIFSAAILTDRSTAALAKQGTLFGAAAAWHSGLVRVRFPSARLPCAWGQAGLPTPRAWCRLTCSLALAGGLLAPFPAVTALQAPHLSLLQSKDGTYLTGGQKRLLLPYAGNCQGLFTPRLVPLSARKQAFPKACQKKYK